MSKNIFVRGSKDIPQGGKVVKFNRGLIAKQLDEHYTRNSLPPEKTMSKEALARLHNAIHFTHAHKMAESMAKHDEEETIVAPK